MLQYIILIKTSSTTFIENVQ